MGLRICQAKYQLISKGFFKVFVCTKKMNEHIFVFLPQPVKRGQEISVLIEGIYFDSLALLF